MLWIISPLFVLAAAAILTAVFRGRLAHVLGAFGNLFAMVLGLVGVGVVAVEHHGSLAPYIFVWPGLFHFEASLSADALSLMILAINYGVGALVILYGARELAVEVGHREVGRTWCALSVTLAGAILATIAHHSILFLVGFELMSLASCALICLHYERDEVRSAAGTYLLAMQVGVSLILAALLLSKSLAGSFAFGLTNVQVSESGLRIVILLLALFGFGVKAGVFPGHVWMPNVYAAAPTYVCALLSGVMTNVALYGLLRVVGQLGTSEASWGWLLIGFGLLSAIWGALSALSQQDVQKVFAYSTMENVGLIMVGFGLGFLGIALHVPSVSILGFVAGFVHLLHHSLAKPAMLFAFGLVRQGLQSQSMNQLGGVMRKMPYAGTLAILAGIALAGLPPFSGFLTEFSLFNAALLGVMAVPFPADVIILIAILGIALVAALILAAFVRFLGLVMLGNPREELACVDEHSRRKRLAPLLAMLALVSLSVGLPWLVPYFGAVVVQVGDFSQPELISTLNQLAEAWKHALFVIGFCLCVLVFVSGARYWLLRGRDVRRGPTWGCGYDVPSPRLQYSPLSFVLPFSQIFGRRPLGIQLTVEMKDELFPQQSRARAVVIDPLRRLVFEPLFRGISRATLWFRWLQHGRVRLYVLYIVVIVVILLAWRIDV